jgi:hypothetical protein
VQHQPERITRFERPFAPADLDGVDRTPVVLRVVFVEAAATMVLHVGCAGRRSHGLAKLWLPRMLGEEGPRGSVSITRER